MKPVMVAAALAALAAVTHGAASAAQPAQARAQQHEAARDPNVPAGPSPAPQGIAEAGEAAAKRKRTDLNSTDQARVRQVTQATDDFSRAEPFELMQAGAATVRPLINADVFSLPSATLDFEGRQRFQMGNSLFRKDWVSSPSSTQASDGLGPLFNARSCQACHVKDGRGTVPGFDPVERSDAVALLMRLAVPALTEADLRRIHTGEIHFLPDPVYGVQLQNFAVAGLPAEGSLEIDYSPVEVKLNGGETATLMRPAYRIENLGYGPMRADVRMSPRLAPPMIGLGLLEAVHEADILANAAADHGDGVRGKPNWVIDARTGKPALGRFNWKASQPTVEQQSAVAFSNDMGLSTPMFPSHYGECTQAQAECFKLPHGAQPHLGEQEVPAPLMDLVADYATNLAVPQRRDVDDARVLAGKKLFYEANCVACHVPKYVTRRDAARPEHRFQLIWPYTDMLLHDMGDGLADDVSEGLASGRDWRTPPLWGIGLTKTVNPNATWLHDGRARTLLEAVLWHGGEAQPARDRVVNMTPEERADLVRFLESL
ncbi:Predicted thiol oxidoreductase [Bordetella ansorpii]|uniref:Predicted thiol oxidoreductase n=2 Tax=Bordetella ansorpii TaxID=288768 RepID=A0A157RNW5_9BORD|nr:di-heme oxidoredictase family protein [Bordetella ansorpii]SAI59566.1 Predicted thiol oxidoreductase [Bordetella ansorpii]